MSIQAQDVLQKSFLPLFLLFVVAVDRSAAQSVVPQDSAATKQTTSPNLWTARNNNGQIFGGTWTAVPDAKTGTVTGTWTLVDAQARTMADGGWSASKSPDGWVGNWRAANFGGTEHEFTGSWRAGVDLKVTAGFAELFGKAVSSAVSGTWRMGNHSGAWSIQVFK
jgi:hypothetical protein